MPSPPSSVHTSPAFRTTPDRFRTARLRIPLLLNRDCICLLRIPRGGTNFEKTSLTGNFRLESLPDRIFRLARQLPPLLAGGFNQRENAHIGQAFFLHQESNEIG